MNNLAFYNYQWDYWLITDKVTFDGVNKIIIVNEGVTSLDIRTDVWSEWIEWSTLQDSRSFLFAIRQTGLDPIPGGVTGDSYFLTNGWKLHIDLSKVRVSGVLFSDDYETPYYTYEGKPQYAAQVSSVVNTVANNVIAYEQPDLTNLAIPTAAQNATAVWTHSNATTLQDTVNALPDSDAMALAVKILLQSYLDKLDATVSSRQPAGTVNANVTHMNNAPVFGIGTENDKWRGGS